MNEWSSFFVSKKKASGVRHSQHISNFFSLPFNQQPVKHGTSFLASRERDAHALFLGAQIKILCFRLIERRANTFPMAMGSVEFSHTHTTKSYLGTASCVTKIKTNRNSFRTLRCLVTNSSKCAIKLSIDAMFCIEANQKGSVHIEKSDRWITCFRRSKVRRTAKATPPPSADAKVKTELSALGTFSVVQVQTS